MVAARLSGGAQVAAPPSMQPLSRHLVRISSQIWWTASGSEGDVDERLQKGATWSFLPA
ncbi:hypothetical protein C2845_PM17G08050 [Panicum miliaceum]|uniref:Uncharacterized protein n=1 Tax=Panicum miliaceum TaxID=4540 RepID=A0A3L6Q3V2_PANMI|nr:hypothetical protein C2845_PM17G08050 [Panicum miliaceum]